MKSYRYTIFTLYLILLFHSSYAQRIVTGRVVDKETGKPVKDASIELVGTEIETRTNVLGFFQVQVDSSSILIIRSNEHPDMRTEIPTDVSSFTIQLTKPTLPKKDSIYVVYEEPASFPGGMAKFYSYLNGNMKFPKDAKRNGITGRVTVEFVIDANGEIPPEEVRVKEGLYPSCDLEAIRLIRESPKWNPGMQKDRSVKQRMVLPVIFK